jgi:hypothetical protein
MAWDIAVASGAMRWWRALCFFGRRCWSGRLAQTHRTRPARGWSAPWKNSTFHVGALLFGRVRRLVLDAFDLTASTPSAHRRVPGRAYLK